MRPYRQTQWHGIQFKSFLATQPYRFAEPSFYDRFYQEFYRRYHSWESLDAHWLGEKTKLAQFIATRVSGLPAPRVLSIGCGIGAVERELIKQVDHLEVTEVSETPLRWLKSAFPSLRTFTGKFPEAIPPSNRYSLIYLSAVEYCFDQESLVALLKSMHAHLEPGGKCLIISASCERQPKPRLKHWVRETLERVAITLGVRPGQQLWGYLRTPQEITHAMEYAGFQNIQSDWHPSQLFWAEGTSPTPAPGANP